MSASEIRALAWAFAIMAVCAVAVWRGQAYERLAAGGMLAAWALTMAFYRSGFAQTEWGILAVDLALMGLLVWTALRSPRYWPIFAAGFHLLALVTHLANLVDREVGAWAYLTAEIFWGYLVIFTVGYGAWTAKSYAPASAAAGATRR